MEKKSVKKNNNTKNSKEVIKKPRNKKVDVKQTKTINVENEETRDLKKLFILILIIILVFGAFYLVTTLLNKKKSNSDNIFSNKELGNTSIQYDEVLVGTMFNQSPDAYYVLVLDKDDVKGATYDSLLKEYATYTYEFKIYTVDMTNALNKKFVGDKNSFDKNDLKFKSTTLLKIKNSEIATKYESDSEVSRVLNVLSSEAKANTK